MPSIAAGNSQFPMGKEFSYEDLQHFTDNFREENFIGRTQFGMLYRGKIPQGWKEIGEQDVAVKMWKTESVLDNGKVFTRVQPQYLLARVKDEIRFLGLPFLESHQNVAKVLGHCFEEDKLGVVYDLKPLDTLRNLIHYSAKLGWRNRIKVALALARLIKLIHDNGPQYLIRNLSARHVVVDQDFNPVVVDFGMILGGDIGSEYPFVPPPHGYMDTNDLLVGFWFTKTDVYSFGIILLELIVKLTYDSVNGTIGHEHHNFIQTRARTWYRVLSSEARTRDEATKRDAKCSFTRRLLGCGPQFVVPEFKCSFVSVVLRKDPDFDTEDGIELTILAVKCVDDRPNRPDMEEVVSKLEKLHICSS